MMAKNATKPTTTVKSDDAAEPTEIDGIRDGRKWTVTSDFFDVLRFVNAVEWIPPYLKPRPWIKCPFPDLREKLESKGRDYSVGFIRGVQDCFQAEYSAYVCRRQQEGIEDGREWASKVSGKQLSRMKAFARDENSRNIFVLPYHNPNYGPEWSSEKLVCFLHGLCTLACYDREYRDFWQPFVKEPITKVLARLEQLGHRAGHKLQDHHYVAGFVDGALGISEQIERRLNDRTPIPPPERVSYSKTLWFDAPDSPQ